MDEKFCHDNFSWIQTWNLSKKNTWLGITDKDKQLFWLDLGPIELGCQQFKRDFSNFEPDCIFFWSKFNQVIDATLLGILIFNSVIAQKQILSSDEKNWNLLSDGDGDDDSNVNDEGAYDEDEGDDDGDD